MTQNNILSVNNCYNQVNRQEIPSSKKENKIPKIAATALGIAGLGTLAIGGLSVAQLGVTGVISIGMGVLIPVGLIGLAAAVGTVALFFLFAKFIKNPKAPVIPGPAVKPSPISWKLNPVTNGSKPTENPKGAQSSRRAQSSANSASDAKSIAHPVQQNQSILKKVSLNLDSLSSSRPKGILRQGNNCCFNVIAQLMIHNKGLRDAFSKNDKCKAFIDAYETYTRVPQLFCQGMREELGGSWTFGGQGDAGIILHEYAKKTGYCNFKVEAKAKVDNPRPIGNSAFVTLSGQAATTEEFIWNNIKPAPDSCEYSDKRFADYPQDLILWHSTREQASTHRNPLTIHLDRELFKDGKMAQYHCDFFVIHVGSNNLGHYFCARKVNNQWYLIDDETIAEITEERAKEYLEGKIEGHAVMGLNYKLYAKEE